MKEFNREYRCRGDDRDLIVIGADDDGAHTVRFSVQMRHRAAAFVYLNRSQVNNMATLLTEWSESMEPGGQANLWEDDPT